MAKQLVEPVGACHAFCVEYTRTNVPAVKGQVTGLQTRGCQLSGQIRVCLNLKLKNLTENPFRSGSLASARPQLLKSQDTLLQTSGRNPSVLWVTAGYWFSPNYSACKQPAAQRGEEGTLRQCELAADAALSLPFHTSAPETSAIGPVASLPALSPFATAVLCQACCITLVFALRSYCIRNPGTEEEAGWQTRAPCAATPTEAEEGAVPGWGVAFPRGRE